MDQNVHLLESVIENARMGLDAVNLLVNKTDDQALRDELLRQKEQYQDIERGAEKRLSQLGEKVKAPNMLNQAGLWAGVHVNTMADKSPSHMADMLIQGSTMGIVDMTQTRAACPNADAVSYEMADHLIAFEQDNIERTKGFL